MGGWIKLSKDIENHWLWDNAEYLKRWIKLRFLTSHEPMKKLVQGRLVEIDRGQAVVSVRLLQDLWAKKNKKGKAVSKPSERTVLNFVNLLEADGLICVDKRQHQFTLLTICNRGGYQNDDNTNDNTDDNTDDNTNDNTNDNKNKMIRRIYNISTASKNFEDGDDFKSQIFSQLDELRSRLDEQEKKPTKKREANPLVSKGREVFEKRYADLYGDNYYWQAKDAVAMGGLTKKIIFARKRKGMSVEEGDVLEALASLLESIADEWLLKNFSVTNINSKYNEIVAQARAKLNYGKTDRQDIQDKRRSSEVTATEAKDYEGAF